MTDYQLHLGDCLEVLRTPPDASVDSIVTDPPYELGFIHPLHAADQPAQAHEGPQTAEDWGNALDKPTPAMLAAAERLRQSINQRRAERQEVVT